jgi:hypothetical protein
MTEVKWTPEPARWRRQGRMRTLTAWVMWTTSLTLLAVWAGLLAGGVQLGGWHYLLLAASAGMMLVCVLFGFRSAEYLEPLRIARRRIMRLRAQRQAPPQGPPTREGNEP